MNIQEVLKAQSDTSKLKDGVMASMAQFIPEFKEYFYFTHETSQHEEENYNQLIFTNNFNFYLPNLSDSSSLHKITLSVEHRYNTLSAEFEEVELFWGYSYQEVAPVYAFLLLNIHQMDKQAISDCQNLFISEMDNNGTKLLKNKGKNLSKESSHEMQFTDFINKMNQEHIQPTLDKPVVYKTMTTKMKFPLEQKTKKNVNEYVADFIRSIHEKQGYSDCIPKIVDTISQYDIIYNHAQLGKQLSEKDNTKLNKI